MLTALNVLFFCADCGLMVSGSLLLLTILTEMLKFSDCTKLNRISKALFPHTGVLTVIFGIFFLLKMVSLIS